jgi:hypothetical protein
MSRTLGVSMDELLGETEKKKCADAELMRKGLGQ